MRVILTHHNCSPAVMSTMFLMEYYNPFTDLSIGQRIANAFNIDWQLLIIDRITSAVMYHYF